MLIVYVVIWAFMLVCGASAILALLWAIKHSELQNFTRAAASIFDAGEPIGQPTDFFPKGNR